VTLLFGGNFVRLLSFGGCGSKLAVFVNMVSLFRSIAVENLLSLAHTKLVSRACRMAFGGALKFHCWCFFYGGFHVAVSAREQNTDCSVGRFLFGLEGGGGLKGESGPIQA
jgi:hypothetical protein